MRSMRSQKVLVAAAVWVVLSGVSRAELPDGARGFSGQVRGVVASKGVKNSFQYRVGRVIRVWKGNKAEKPEALVGRTVAVGPRWHKGEDGRWSQVPAHVAFIRRLEPGQEITLEICNSEMRHFEILELSGDQREDAEGGGEEEPEEEGAGKAGRVTHARESELETELDQLRREVRRLREELGRRKK